MTKCVNSNTSNTVAYTSQQPMIDCEAGCKIWGLCGVFMFICICEQPHGQVTIIVQAAGGCSTLPSLATRCAARDAPRRGRRCQVANVPIDLLISQ